MAVRFDAGKWTHARLLLTRRRFWMATGQWFPAFLIVWRYAVKSREHPVFSRSWKRQESQQLNWLCTCSKRVVTPIKGVGRAIQCKQFRISNVKIIGDNLKKVTERIFKVQKLEKQPELTPFIRLSARGIDLKWKADCVCGHRFFSNQTVLWPGGSCLKTRQASLLA